MGRPIPTELLDLGLGEIYTIDAEFRPANPDAYIKHELSTQLMPDTLEPICLSVKRWTTGEIVTYWYRMGDPCPLPTGNGHVVVCFHAPAEWSYFLAAGWELSTNIVDLYAEYRRVVNGHFDQYGKKVDEGEHKDADGRTKYGLISAGRHYGLGSRTGVEKRSAVSRILAGPPFSEEEKESIIRYNQEDVEDTEQLFHAMCSRGDIPIFGQALQRGDVTRGFALRDLNGLPLDCALVARLQNNWQSIRSRLAHDVENRRGYDVFRFDADDTAHFDTGKMCALVARLGMVDIWPRTETDELSFADPDRGGDEHKPFKMMARLNPYLEDLRETRRLLEKFKTLDLPIGPDGRCHGRYAPWTQVTGRSSPGKGSIFGMPAWTRWLIKPGVGRGVAYVDLKSAEFGIGAGLSRDANMMHDYMDMLGGAIECVYFELAKRAGQVPPDSMVKDHKAVRKLWKTACLAMMYGQSPHGLSIAAGTPLSQARIIQDAFLRRYSTYWAWTDREVVHAHIKGRIKTVCGWDMEVNDRTGDPTLFNFHPQATCADIMRRAVTLMADRGIAICEIVHDAVLIEDDVESLDKTVEVAKECWREAGRDIVNFDLDADAKVFKFPHQYEDEDGEPMWRVLMDLLIQAEDGPPLERHSHG